MRLQRCFKRVLFASHNVISVLLSDQIALNSTSPAIAHALEQRKNQTARKNASAKSKETRAQREKTSAGRRATGQSGHHDEACRGLHRQWRLNARSRVVAS